MIGKIKQLVIPLVLLLALAVAPMPVVAQTSMTQTVLSSALTLGGTTMVVGSATGFTANTTRAFIDMEAVDILSVSGTTITLKGRGMAGTRQSAHATNSVVFVGPFAAFQTIDPVGSCTSTLVQYLPWINLRNGNLFGCDTNTGIWQSVNLTPGLNGFPFHSVTLTSLVTAYTAKLYDTWIEINTSVASTVTLPAITGVYGKVIIIKGSSSSGSSITVSGSSNQGVGLATAGTTATITTTGAVLRLMSSGTFWQTW